MVKTLLKKQFAEIFRNYFYDTRKNKARSKAGTVGYILFFILIMVVLLGGTFAATASSLCAPLYEAGAGWLYFAIMGVIAILLGIFGSVFSTYTGLYLAKDNDLLLSLPIPVGTIMLARLMGVYLMGLMYAAVVIVPAILVYLTTVPFSFSALIGCIVYLLLISVFVLVLSCLLGWVVAKLSTRLKNKSIVTVLVALLGIGIYYFAYFKAMNLIRDLIMWRLLGRSFLSLATATGSGEKVKYTARRAKQRSVPSALLSKEFSKLTSNANYMLNCALGTLLIPVLGVALLIKGPAVIDVLSSVFGDIGAVAVLLCTALCMSCSMNDCAAPSISLEGKNIWIAQSLPVDPWQILRAKLRVQLLLTMPSLLFASLCAVIVLKAPLALSLALLALPQLFALFFALLSLTLDLAHANLSWTNELAPIKQSMPVTVALLGGWGFSILLAGVYLLLTPPFGAAVYLLCFAAITAVGCLILYLRLRRRGGKDFMEL